VKSGDVGREYRCCTILAAAPTDDESRFLDPLTWLALAAGELGEQLAFQGM
jgi:hypothetical protein